MNVESTTKAIERLLREMMNLDQFDRVHHYATIKVLIDQLGEIAIDNDKTISAEVASLLWSCASIAGLSEGNGHPDENHVGWASAELRKIGLEMKDVAE